ncbi:quinoprotein dehydrogenase-associated putative ABC transporter substrate-binding protein [Azohydromonas caseinilytica]|uniref:Quinoprotein dehydrogenase-associated putative ABC transporter substrate-binding protein n=1 Tax=Azohydromonas caseinilytica TaxID=2728836 RepID=A0A848FCZ1_9BURK|nr:quinoprotein dehydrogenase-associated putative ABC transporter substrate-binding protein [Azohydromonas caseinilytica]NML15811.1 quinoprotein dehydrogenase-associated putative ABC transporter substrate-binding protein [Azohydromonas caseinilytica]
MNAAFPRSRRRGWSAALFLGALVAAAPAAAQEEPPRQAFKVCQDPHNLPFSSAQGNGIENRIAELFARDLGLKLEYYNFPNRLAFIRNTLRYKLPGEDWRCDVVLGVPEGFDQVSVTKPYYRSTYALVFPRGKALDAVRTGQDFLQLNPAVLSKLRIGVHDRSPGSQWLAKHQLVDRAVVYPMMSPDTEHDPGQAVEQDLAAGRIDAAILWGPMAGFAAKRQGAANLVVVPLASEPGVRFDYAMAMGVRYGEPQWKGQIEGLIERHRPAIQAILREYGVPLVEQQPAGAGGRPAPKD